MSVRVRDLRAEDEADWRHLWRAYLRFYGTELPEATYADTFRRLLSDDPWQPFGMVAEMDEQTVGLAHGLFHSHCWRAERSLYLQDLYADPQARGRGVGRALIEAIYRRADREGSVHVYWITGERNRTARQPHDRLAREQGVVMYERERP